MPQGHGILLFAGCKNSLAVMLSSRTPRRADLKKVTLRPTRLCSCSRSGLKCSAAWDRVLMAPVPGFSRVSLSAETQSLKHPLRSLRSNSQLGAGGGFCTQV